MGNARVLSSDEIQQIINEAKAASEKPANGGADNVVSLPPPDGLEISSAAEIDMQAVTWLWPDRFGLGKFGIVGGMPDMGKGQICAYIAAAATAALPLPCGEGTMPQGNVLWFNAEDGTADTVVPRLVAAGADLSRVHIVKAMRSEGKERTFSLVTDLPYLRKAIERIGNVVLVIIDPVSAYVGVGKVNSGSASDVRGFLKPLTDMAEELNVAVIGIAHFNKKADVTSAMLRISDSIAYVAAARHVYVVVDDPNVEGRRLFVKAKNNLAPDKRALSYVIGLNTNVGHDTSRDVDISAPYVIWGSELVSVTANEAMQAAADGGRTGRARDEAEQFLRDRLSAGPVKIKDIEGEATAHGISRAALKRARKELGIKPSKEKRMDGEWYLELPPSPEVVHPGGWELD